MVSARVVVGRGGRRHTVRKHPRLARGPRPTGLGASCMRRNAGLRVLYCFTRFGDSNRASGNYAFEWFGEAAFISGLSGSKRFARMY